MSSEARKLCIRYRSYIVIPARLASTRLPRKLLLAETGKTVIQHTYESASHARRPLGVVVAADSQEIADEVRRFGGQSVLTDPAAATGTDRVAEAARALPGADVIVNVQGDEPEIAATSIDLSVRLLEENPDAVMATLATPIRSRCQLEDPACVKVTFDADGRALYFSRSPIPYVRDSDEWMRDAPLTPLHHLGIYSFRREFLLRYAAMPPAPLEQAEKLEQLRALSAGYRIKVGITPHRCIGIDTPEDLQRWLALYR